jgi:hypothetical protein
MVRPVCGSMDLPCLQNSLNMPKLPDSRELRDLPDMLPQPIARYLVEWRLSDSRILRSTRNAAARP